LLALLLTTYIPAISMILNPWSGPMTDDLLRAAAAN